MPDAPINPINPSGTAGVDVDGQPVPSLLQMAMGSTNQFAPSWVKEQLGAYMRENPGSNIGFGGIGNLEPQLNPDNWGPPPSVQGPAEASGGGWFPNLSGMAAPDPNEKFWTMKDYNRQSGGGAVGDESPNTRNWRLLQGAPSSGPVGPGVEPGNFMYLGHPISQSKLQYDTHRPISDPPTAGSFLPYRGFGRGSSGWSTTGEVGFPGQLDPFATSWGAGGPGG